MQEAEKAGSDFTDLNYGCPIFEATRRDLGSIMSLHSPTVRKFDCAEVVQTLREAGAAAITIHG